MTRDFPTTIQEIQKGEIAPIYFLNGDDFYLQDFFIDQVEKVLSKKTKIEKVYLVSEVTDFTQILVELTSISLFPEPKLFILQNPVQIKGKNRKELLEYCKSPNLKNYLIIIVDKYDPKSKLINELSRILGRVNTSPPFPNKMVGWVKFLLKQHNLTAEPNAIDRLIELNGDSVYHIANEIEKIELDLGDEKIVTEEIIQKYAGWERSFFPWHLLDAVGSRDFKRANHIGKNLIHQGMDLSMIISLMTNMFQELFFMYLPSDKTQKSNFKGSWISEQIKRKLSYYQMQYQKNHIKTIFHYLKDADIRIKTTSIRPNSLLIPLLYRVINCYG